MMPGGQRAWIYAALAAAARRISTNFLGGAAEEMIAGTAFGEQVEHRPKVRIAKRRDL